MRLVDAPGGELKPQVCTCSLQGEDCYSVKQGNRALQREVVVVRVQGGLMTAITLLTR